MTQPAQMVSPHTTNPHRPLLIYAFYMLFYLVPSSVLPITTPGDPPLFSQRYPLFHNPTQRAFLAGRPHWSSLHHTWEQANTTCKHRGTLPYKTPTASPSTLRILNWSRSPAHRAHSGVEEAESCQEHLARLRAETKQCRGFSSTRNLCISQLTVHQRSLF